MADEKALLDRLRTVLVSVLCCPADNITPEARFIDDLNADDLDMGDVAVAIEDEWDLGGIPDEEIDKWLTIQDSLNYLKTLPELEG